MYYLLRRPMPRGHHAFSTTVPGRREILSKAVLRRTGYIVLLGVTGYIVDREVYASTAVRNLHTFWTVRVVFRKNSRAVPLINFQQCALIAADYKLNFRPGKSDYISALHERVGDRLLNLFTSNGGLYIKFGVSCILVIGEDVPRHT
jgi:aarF domain-containing kinase